MKNIFIILYLLFCSTILQAQKKQTNIKKTTSINNAIKTVKKDDSRMVIKTGIKGFIDKEEIPLSELIKADSIVAFYYKNGKEIYLKIKSAEVAGKYNKGAIFVQYLKDGIISEDIKSNYFNKLDKKSLYFDNIKVLTADTSFKYTGFFRIRVVEG